MEDSASFQLKIGKAGDSAGHWRYHEHVYTQLAYS